MDGRPGGGHRKQAGRATYHLILETQQTMLTLVPERDLPSLDSIVSPPMNDPLELYKKFLQMEIVCEREGGIGLSAVQVGLPWKIFVVKSDGSVDFAPKGKYGYFINCEYEPTTNAQQIVSLEGCLSLRSPEGRLRHFQVERWSEIRVLGSRLTIIENQLSIIEFEKEIGLREQSVVFQHEIDHQRAVLISDRGQEVLLWR